MRSAGTSGGGGRAPGLVPAVSQLCPVQVHEPEHGHGAAELRAVGVGRGGCCARDQHECCECRPHPARTHRSSAAPRLRPPAAITTTRTTFDACISCRRAGRLRDAPTRWPQTQHRRGGCALRPFNRHIAALPARMLLVCGVKSRSSPDSWARSSTCARSRGGLLCAVMHTHPPGTSFGCAVGEQVLQDWS